MQTVELSVNAVESLLVERLEESVLFILADYRCERFEHSEQIFEK